MQRDNDAIEASEQIKALLDLSHVDCDDAEEAIGSLFCGHRSLYERKISVGNRIVVCIVHKDDDNIDGFNDDDDDGHNGSLEIRRFSSKKH